jgi:hypothetical protein
MSNDDFANAIINGEKRRLEHSSACSGGSTFRFIVKLSLNITATDQGCNKDYNRN